MRRTLATLAAVTLATASMLVGVGQANAQDAWPVDPGQGSPVRPVDVTSFALTPDRLEFYNPFIGLPRIISPYGTTTKIVCTGFRGYDNCWQADQAGNPHKLRPILGLGSSTPASNVFLYPGMIPGL